MPDGRAAPTVRLDPAPVLGPWSNTNHRSWGISHAELVRRDGGLDVRIIGADPQDQPHDWGRAPVSRLFTDGPGSDRVCAYTATFELAHARAEIQANVNHGLTVLAALTSFTDGSGRLSYLTREFLSHGEPPAALDQVRSGALVTTRPAATRGEDRLPMLRGSIDPAPLLCRWTNTDRASRGIAEIRCGFQAGQLRVRVVAVGPRGPIDWGEVAASLHTDLSITGGGRARLDVVPDGHPAPYYADVSATDAGPAFWATFDHGFQRVQLQARIYLGVLVVAMFTEFTDDSGRADYFHREFFIRAG